MISSFDEKTIETLSKFLDECPFLGKVKMAAFLVKREKIISTGNNQITINASVKLLESLTGSKLSFRKENTTIGTLHAEMVCFEKLGFNQKKVRGSTLYVRGVSRSQNTLKSRPCEACLRLSSLLGVERIVYSNKGNEIVEEYV